MHLALERTSYLHSSAALRTGDWGLCSRAFGWRLEINKSISFNVQPPLHQRFRWIFTLVSMQGLKSQLVAPTLSRLMGPW